MKSLLFLILLTSTVSLKAEASNSFEAAKRAAESLKTHPVVPATTNKPAPKEEVSSASKPEGMDTLICPAIGPQFIKTSNTTFRSMDDLISALREERKQYVEFFLMLLQLDKTKPDDEVAASQMVDLKKGVDQKLKRAKENYNSQIKDLALSLPKSKRCWSYHEAKIKPEIGRLLEIFTKEPVLSEFKECVKILGNNNKLYEQKFTLSLNYYNKATSQGTTISEAKKTGLLIEQSEIQEKKICQNFTPEGLFSDYLNNKYEVKKTTPPADPKTVDLTQPLTIPRSVGPAAK